jgi:hypothetical protein
MKYTCQNCGVTTDISKDLCNPINEGQGGKFCGTPSDRICDDKQKNDGLQMRSVRQFSGGRRSFMLSEPNPQLGTWPCVTLNLLRYLPVDKLGLDGPEQDGSTEGMDEDRRDGRRICVDRPAH